MANLDPENTDNTKDDENLVPLQKQFKHFFKKWSGYDICMTIMSAVFMLLALIICIKSRLLP